MLRTSELLCGSMFSTFSECAPYVVAFTIFASGMIALRWQKADLHHLDSLAALLGFGLGLFITFLNLVYSNDYLITLGPVLAFVCALYLRYRNQILATKIGSFLTFDPKVLRIIKILYWISLAGAIIIYYLAPVYTRPPLFFICISLCVALLGLEALSWKSESTCLTFLLIGKILLTSLVLRASAFFISPYPVGQDPWAHAEYIKNFLYFAHLEVMTYPHGTGVSEYYLQYPIMHLFAVVTDLVCDLSVKNSMFVVGAVLALSTIFVYLSVRCLVKNPNVALFAILLVNFADFHIQWSIEVIAMTFGIALYTILLYAIVRNWQSPRKFYQILMLLCIFLIVWTHTVTTFVTLTSLIALAIASAVYPLIYNRTQDRKVLVGLIIITFFLMLLIMKWMDPSYPFFEGILKNLQNSLSVDAEFLGRTGGAYAAECNLGKIFDIIGFLVYVTLGIFGCLCCLSEKYADKARVSLVMMICALFFVFFAFPLMGLRNILPYRWPAFIYTTLVLFVSLGLMKSVNIFRNQSFRQATIFFLLLCTTFFMTTNFTTNMDSPIYQKDVNRDSILSESEVVSSIQLSNVYSGRTVSDGMVIYGPLKYYLREENCDMIQFEPSGEIKWGLLQNSMFLWRECTLTRSVYLGVGVSPFPLGNEFKEKLDADFNCLYDIGTISMYMNRSSQKSG